MSETAPLCPNCGRALPESVAKGPPQAVLRCEGCAALLLWSNGKVVRTAKAGSTVTGLPAVKPPAPAPRKPEPASVRDGDAEPPLSELKPEEERAPPSAVPAPRSPSPVAARPAGLKPAAPPAAPKRTILGLPTPAPAARREPSAPISVGKQPSKPIAVGKQPSKPIAVGKQPSKPIAVGKEPATPGAAGKAPPASRQMIAQVAKETPAAPGPLVNPQAWFDDPSGCAPRGAVKSEGPAPLPPPPAGPAPLPPPPSVDDLLSEPTPIFGVEAIPEEPLEPKRTLAMPTVAPAASTHAPAPVPAPPPPAAAPPTKPVETQAGPTPPAPQAPEPLAPAAHSEAPSIVLAPEAASAPPSLVLAPEAASTLAPLVPRAEAGVAAPALPSPPDPLGAVRPGGEPALDDFGLMVARPARFTRKQMVLAAIGMTALLLVIGIGVALPGKKRPAPIAHPAPAPIAAAPAPIAPSPAPTAPTSPSPTAAPKVDPASAAPAAAAVDTPADPVRPHNHRFLGGKKVVLEYDPKPADPPPPVATPAGEDPAVVTRARAAYHRGNQRLFAGDDAGAVAAYREALRIYPGYVAGYRGLGLAYEEQGARAQALESLRTYVRTVPNARDVGLIRKRIDHLAHEK